MENDFTYKSQDVSYLGFLEAQLRDLQGITTLTYELIQNADDARDENGRFHTTTLTFDITDEALIVTSDGVFRPLDFTRMQNIASGGKRDEANTTGAFGLGFIAVYQITDRPEIFSSGRHWIIRPDAPPDQRIQERQAETNGTQFRLPWAFDPASVVRRTLRIEPVRMEQLDAFATHMSAAVESAALFLQQLHILEVRRNGTLVRRIERHLGPEAIILQDETGRMTTWLLFHGEFTAAAAQLRTQYSWQIEPTRRSTVQIALPQHQLVSPGRLFAGLPTESTIPLSSYIHADFFPTTDRKRIHFDGGYQAAWNEAAITCAAQALAQHLDTLPAKLGPTNLWHLLQTLADTHQLAIQGKLPAIFAAFWQAITPLLTTLPIVYTAQGEWYLPAAARLPAPGMSETAVSLLAALHIPICHLDLAPYFTLMRRPEIATAPLTIPDLTQALSHAGLTRSKSLHELSVAMRSLHAWQNLWDVIDILLDQLARLAQRDAALADLNQVAVVLTNRMTLEKLPRVYHGKEAVQALFPDVAWAHDLLTAKRFPGRYLSNFGVRQAVTWLADIPIDQLESAWHSGQLNIPDLFRWFEAQQIEIFADDPALQREICRLPLCPVAGELRPLNELYIPGGFTDPLQLTGLVDLPAIGGRQQFLHDLGVRELDFDTYVTHHLPRALAEHPDLPSDGRQQLVQLLAQRLGEMQDDEALQTQLSRLPLIACLDGSFRAAQDVYAERDVLILLGERIRDELVHIAEPVESKAIRALHRWLGVRTEPSGEDVVQALLTVSQEWRPKPKKLNTSTQDRVWQCWHTLAAQLAQGTIKPAVLAPLTEQPTIPDPQRHLARPDQLFWVDAPDLAAQFMEAAAYLLSPQTDLQAVMIAAGVRPLTQAVQVQMLTDQVKTETAVQERIANRLPLLNRLLQAEAIASSQQTDLLRNLHVLVAGRLHIQYQLPLSTKAITTDPTAVAAKLIAETATLYITEPVLWAAVARELALYVKPGSAIGTLAIGIKEVLVAETAVAAAQVLDELGYP